MAEKKHQPTDRRLRDVRKRGEVVTSHDVTSTFVFVGSVILLWLLGSTLYDLLNDLISHAFSPRTLSSPDVYLTPLLQQTVMVLLYSLVPFAAVELIFGMAGAFAQVGGLMAWTRIKPDMKRLNPAEGLKRMFSSRNVINLVKMLIKTLLLGALMYVVIRSSLNDAVRSGYGDVFSILHVAAHLIMVVFAWAILIYIIMAAVDYVHVRYEFMKQNRMSTDEVRREHKDSEGDPILLSRRRAAQQEAVYASLVDRVAASSAVIYSKEVALAIQYRGPKDLPRVIGKGIGQVAAQIRRHAKEQLIPMQEDADLAHRLYEEVMIDRPVPRYLYIRIAKLLRWATGKE
ncbi:MAG TPA: EscU/YscU/HrcU family type III secretion system export apparatus switch protein [Burkholderiaceae bacterium]|nr:EscU/YscU/HrcU family type III secretion system export apparatus switch protein [Burkholderiaceae bacterium]